MEKTISDKECRWAQLSGAKTEQIHKWKHKKIPYPTGVQTHVAFSCKISITVNPTPLSPPVSKACMHRLFWQ
jgi:hypothetical protein